MHIEPIRGHVLVQPVEKSKQTPGGIHLPDSAGQDQNEAMVVAVADDAIEEVTEGDRVIHSRHGGTEISMEGEDYLLLTSDELLVKYVETDTIPS